MYRTLKLSLTLLALPVAFSAARENADTPTSRTIVLAPAPSTRVITTMSAFAIRDSGSDGTMNSTMPADTIGFEAAMKEYEDVMHEYIAIVKKAKTDPATDSELSTLSTKMQAMVMKLTEIAPKMTPEQAERFSELAQKLAADMQAAAGK
jgi:hypothetical protein